MRIYPVLQLSTTLSSLLWFSELNYCYQTLQTLYCHTNSLSVSIRVNMQEFANTLSTRIWKANSIPMSAVVSWFWKLFFIQQRIKVNLVWNLLQVHNPSHLTLCQLFPPLWQNYVIVISAIALKVWRVYDLETSFLTHINSNYPNIMLILLSLRFDFLAIFDMSQNSVQQATILCHQHYHIKTTLAEEKPL